MQKIFFTFVLITIALGVCSFYSTVENGYIWLPWLVTIGNLCHFTLRQWVVPIDEDVPISWPKSRHNPEGLPAYYKPTQPLIGAGLGILVLGSNLLGQETATTIGFVLISI